GPFAEDATYVSASGRVYNGTRGPFGSNFANNTFQSSFGNSNYNSLQTSLRHSSKRLDLMFSYTFSKSIDQSSALGDPVDPFNYKRTRALSAWDLTHNIVATYEYQLPFELLTRKARIATQGWSLSGITRISSGFPVTIHSDGDNSLQGSLPNGV